MRHQIHCVTCGKYLIGIDVDSDGPTGMHSEKGVAMHIGEGDIVTGLQCPDCGTVTGEQPLLSEFVRRFKAIRPGLAPKRPVSLLVTDVDNTLFDWLAMWHAAFSDLLREISRISGIPSAQLEPDIRRIHQRYGTVEYAFLIEHLSRLRRQTESDSDLRARFDPAIRAYRDARARTLKPYNGVVQTLEYLRSTGCTVVAYTESFRYQSTVRFKQLGLDGLIDYLYSPEDYELPDQRPDLQGARLDAEASLLFTQHRTTPRGELKPNPRLLQDIVREVGGQIERTVYVGDSLVKDVWMAQRAGVTDVFAAYGAPGSRPEYELLRRVSHWPDQTVASDRTTTIGDVRPTYILRKGFDELLEFFQFEALVA